MKLSEDILQQFDLDPKVEREPVNSMPVKEALELLKECANRMISKSNVYRKTENADEQLDCIDIVISRLNEFTQIFKDIVIFMRKKEQSYKGNPDSLRYCIMSYDTFEFDKTTNEDAFLKELLLRNEITHDYFNRSIHQQKLIQMMTGCIEGAKDVYEHLYDYCSRQGLMEDVIP